MGEMISYQAGETTASGYLALPESGSGPGVLVVHAWWGLNSFFKSLCDRLAQEGFVAFAPDLYGGKVGTTVEEAQQLLEAMDFQTTKSIATLAIQVLKERAQAEEGLGAIGFSMGSSWVLLLSCTQPDDFRAVALFYGSEVADFTRAKAAYIAHFAENDDREPVEGVRNMEADMRAAGVRLDLYIYPGAGHWFFEKDRPEYEAEAAEKAWKRTIHFFRKQLLKKVNGGEPASTTQPNNERYFV